MDAINKRFKDLRKALNKSQEDMGKILGLSKSGVSNIENGQRNVTEQHFIMLKNWHEKSINIDWLRTGEGEMFNDLSDEDDFMRAATDLRLEEDKLVMEAVIKYWKMSKEHREIFKNYIMSVAEACKKGEI